jgi:hypothetical protein
MIIFCFFFSTYMCILSQKLSPCKKQHLQKTGILPKTLLRCRDSFILKTKMRPLVN